MSMTESVARLEASQLEPEYYWWKGADLKAVWEQVERHGGLERVRVELHLGLNEDGYPDAWWVVVALDEIERNGGPPINYSHTCPPDCG